MMLTATELLKLFILSGALQYAAPNQPSNFDEYKSFLDAPYEESEEPCEVSAESANPLLTSWYERNCK
jgi:hypothetical protein